MSSDLILVYTDALPSDINFDVAKSNLYSLFASNPTTLLDIVDNAIYVPDDYDDKTTYVVDLILQYAKEILSGSLSSHIDYISSYDKDGNSIEILVGGFETGFGGEASDGYNAVYLLSFLPDRWWEPKKATMFKEHK